MGQFKWMSIAIVALLLAVVAPAWAEESEPGAADAQAQEMTEKQDEHGAGYRLGSLFMTSVNIPLRGLLCVGSTVGAGVFYVATFGTAVNAAVYMVKEGCSGPWIITPEIMKGKPRKSD